MKLSLARSSCALALGPVHGRLRGRTGRHLHIHWAPLTATWTNPFPDLTPGTPFTGCYTFNLATPDINQLDWVSDYWHVGAPYGIQFQIGSHAFRTNNTSPTPAPPFLVELVNNQSGQDDYLLRSYYNLPTDGWQVNHISWQLDDPTQQQFSSTALTGVPPVPSQWQQMFGLMIAGPSNRGPCAANRHRAGGAVPSNHHHDAGPSRTSGAGRTAGAAGTARRTR